MTDIVDRLRFDAARCELQFSKGVAENIEEAANEIVRMRNVYQAPTPLAPETAADNAALIAAIPQMVAALKEARGCLADDCLPWLRHSSPREGTAHGLIDDVVKQIDAVLASIGRTK